MINWGLCHSILVFFFFSSAKPFKTLKRQESAAFNCSLGINMSVNSLHIKDMMPIFPITFISFVFLPLLFSLLLVLKNSALSVDTINHLESVSLSDFLSEHYHASHVSVVAITVAVSMPWISKAELSHLKRC